MQVANYLKDIGVKKGDAVIIYLPMLMELPITMLACARIGAVHSVFTLTLFNFLPLTPFSYLSDCALSVNGFWVTHR